MEEAFYIDQLYLEINNLKKEKYHINMFIVLYYF